LGGVVTAAIVVTSAGALSQGGGSVTGAAEMAAQLEPLLGRWARLFFATGLLAAGLTSAITAPLAAAYAAAGALGWPRDLRDRRLRAVWAVVILTGAAFALTGVRPVPAILFAQVANGVLLPAVAVFLLLAANDERMGQWRNGPFANTVGALVVRIRVVLGGWAVGRAVGGSAQDARAPGTGRAARTSAPAFAANRRRQCPPAHCNASRVRPSSRGFMQEVVMSDPAVREARRALQRLKRAAEKVDAELSAVRSALRHAEGDDFPHADFDAAADHAAALLAFCDEQAERLQDKILHAGGLEPGRVRRSAG